MRGLRAVLDADVLFPTVMREVLTGCAAEGMFVPLWSDRILEEWARAAARLGPGAEAVARGEVAALRARWPEAAVETVMADERRLRLPDPDDVHVLAAAVAGRADAVVTRNAGDFPRLALAAEGLRRLDPDEFLLGLWREAPEAVERVVAGSAATATRLSGEEWTPDGLLRKARLFRLARALRGPRAGTVPPSAI